MKELLHNFVYNALCSGDAHLSLGSGDVKYFDEQVSPFVGIKDGHANGFDYLHSVFPPGRRILYANRGALTPPSGWRLAAAIEGLQFILPTPPPAGESAAAPVPLTTENVPEMIALTRLTKPGPFDTRTIAFGHYHGIVDKGQLVAMTGQRLHVSTFTEISAVCTHPDHLGKGYAAALLRHQAALIFRNSQTPYLHVRADNERAITLYKRLGFEVNGPMNFYFLQRL